MTIPIPEKVSWLDRRAGGISWEQAVYALLIVLAVAGRFVMLGVRAQSHDESLHTRYSWELYNGQGFSHTPLMHGPFLFHAAALSYWLFGDSDASARLPVALLGVVLVALPYLLRRQLGRVGALATSFLLLISPSLLYYSRYIRMDVPVIVFTLVLVFAIWAYLNRRGDKHLYWFTAALALMFTTKEVAFIYVAIIGSFLVMRLVAGMLRDQWPQDPTGESGTTLRLRGWFQIGLVGLLVGALTFGVGMAGANWAERAAPDENLGAELGAEGEDSGPTDPWSVVQVVGGAVGCFSLALAIGTAVVGMGARLREYPEFDLVVLFSTLLLPFITPIPVTLLRADPLDYSFDIEALRQLGVTPFIAWLYLLVVPIGLLAWYARVRRLGGKSADRAPQGGLAALKWVAAVYALTVPLATIWTFTILEGVTGAGVFRSAAVFLPLLAASVAVGLWWDWRRWLGAAGLFYTITVVLFTTVFTNGRGFATGWIGSLGYWLVQQDVKRGDQPFYFYAYLVPIYEFLPLLGTAAAATVWFARDRGAALVGRLLSQGWQLEEEDRVRLFGFVPFLLWWTLGTWILYSYSGEKMGWLITHFAVPMILLAGWALGRLLRSADWSAVWKAGGWAVAVLLPVLTAGLVRGVGPAVLGQLDVGSQQLDSLIVAGRALGGAVVAVGAGVGLVHYTRGLSQRNVLGMLALSGAALLAVLTARSAWIASYINYDNPKEQMVYAHGASATKLVMEQIEDISLRMHGDLGIRVAFDNDSSWPFWWYLRDYPNKVYFGESPSRDSLDVPVAVVGDKNWAKVEPYLGSRYHSFEYTFLWWPMEDYKNLTWERVSGALSNPDMVAALWDIFVDRDYTRYAEVTGRDFSLASWPLRHQMRFYVRKDVVAQLWDYGVGPSAAEASFEDPYEKGFRLDLSPVSVIGRAGQAEGELQSPRDIALGPDGYLYVADSMNNRVQVFQTDGESVRGWGSLCDLEQGAANCVDPDGAGPQPPGAGQFKEPWGVAVAADGTVYVADTWNHRVQRFTSEGEFLGSWGQFGQVGPGQSAGVMGVFYGPRDIAISGEGLLYVSDTGNKRIQVFEADGRYVGEFGEGGPLDGQMDEQVGLDFGPDGLLYVADTWNGRVAVWDQKHTFVRKWAVEGWYGQSVNNKPYLAAGPQGMVYVTDPEMYRVLVFDLTGDYQYGFGRYSDGVDGVALPTGIAVGDDGTVYVSDAGNHRIVAYSP